MQTIDDILLDAEDKMDKAVKYLQEEYQGLRSGKASPAMVENIQVEYYGTPTRMRELGNISTPEPRLLVISPFDPSVLPEIEKAITAANIGIHPINDGRLIRIPVPELSEERRKEIIKVASRQAEEQRVAIRNVRREANDAIKALQKAGDITEDDRDGALAEIQKLTDQSISGIDQHFASKEKELMEV